MRRHHLFLCAVVACLVPRNADADLVGIGNIIVNGGAEAGPGGEGEVVSVPAWTTTGNATVVFYGASGGFPSASSPGPADRGLNFFAGGSGASSTLTQLIDGLTAFDIAAIDAGGLPYDLSGWLGGLSTNGDNATLAVDFLDSVGGALDSASIGPVSAADRSNVTGLLFRSTAGDVPVGTRSIFLTLTFSRTNGVFNDGYADNLSLSLGEPVAAPEPSSLTLLGLSVVAMAGCRWKRAARSQAAGYEAKAAAVNGESPATGSSIPATPPSRSSPGSAGGRRCSRGAGRSDTRITAAGSR